METGIDIRTFLAVAIPILSSMLAVLFYLFKKIHDFELKMKDLEKKDELQQMVIDDLKNNLPTLLEITKQLILDKTKKK